MDYTALKAELAAGHPDTGAYNADDTLAAGELNVVNRTRNRTRMSGAEVKVAFDLDATTRGEWAALTDAQKSQMLSLTARDDLDPFGVDAMLFNDIASTATATKAQLAVARVEDVSRAEELGFGVVTWADVDTARRSG
jgi:hypothetical protein